MLSYIALLSLAQIAPNPVKPQGPPMGPMLTPGANEAFLSTCLRAEDQIAKGDFSGAKATIGLLPKRKITIEWDDAKVPVQRRQEFIVARDKALNGWAKALGGIKWTFAKHGDLRFTFVPTLPPNPDSPTPAGAVQFASDNPKDPRVEVVIALKRSSPPVAAESYDVHNEVAYGIVMYYGIARNIGAGIYSTRTEVATFRYSSVGRGEIMIARSNLGAVDMLRDFIQKKQRIVPARPEAHLDPTEIEGGSATQGDLVPYSIQISNLGNSDLRIDAVPDCGCVAISRLKPIPKGSSALMRMIFDTAEFVGDLGKKVVLYTNDPDRPVIHVPIRVRSNPLYRFISANGYVAALGPNGGMYTIYFIPSPGTGLEPVDTSIEGVPASVSVSKWSGMLADPEMNEPEMQRSGYKIVVDYDPGLPAGRSLTSLVVTTNAKQVLKANGERFEVLRRSIQVQNGIIAMPENLNVGEISRMPQRFHFLVSKPNIGFKILKLESSDPHLKLSAVPSRENWEYRVTIQYDGKAEFGQLDATFKVHTDDRRSPLITVPFRAVVR